MFEALEKRLAYTFREPLLLERALIHRSFLNENPDFDLGHNERLEFLGDSVIEFVASFFLYEQSPEMSEGYMTRLRAGIVRTETLADFARSLGLGELIRMAKGEEETGGRERTTNLCDTFEAVVGALFLDGGIEAAKELLIPLYQPVLENILRHEADKDAKSLFQEWSQAVLGITPVYKTIYQSDNEQDRTFIVEVVIGSQPVGWGNGKSKQNAEQAAARQALKSARS